MDRKMDMRREIDIAAAAATLVVLSLPMAFIWTAIKLTDPKKSAIFRQTRYGLHNGPFTIYKFRTMDDEKRITWIGSKLRDRNIDELPQLWNIVKGEMSIAGPRPLMEQPPIEGWAKRNEIKGGFYSLTSIRAKLGLIPPTFEEHLKSDLEYITYRRTHGKMRNFGYDLGLAILGCKVFRDRKGDHGKFQPATLPKPALAESKP